MKNLTMEYNRSPLTAMPPPLHRRPSKRDLLPGNWSVDQVIGERQTKQGREVLVRWEGYDHRGDTWEPEEHVHPRSKVAKFDSGLPVLIV